MFARLFPALGVYAPAVYGYKALLELRASGKWHRLSPEFIHVLGPYYKDIDLRRVEYATNVDTVHGMAITLDNKIYFPKPINLHDNRGDVGWLLHELEHVSQYNAHGGLIPFLTKYLINGGLEISKNRSFNVHDHIGLEKDANNKRDRIIEDVINDLRIADVSGVRERFRAIDGYAGKCGDGAGFPNFHQADYGAGVVYGAHFLKPKCIESKDVPATALGSPSTPEEMFRAVDEYAVDNGFAAGFPNFHEADYGEGVVYGVHFIKKPFAVHTDIPISTLGHPQTIEERFRAVDGYVAGNTEFDAGFPNFHQADYGEGVVFGARLIRKEAVSRHEDVYATALSARYRSSDIYEEKKSDSSETPVI